jgi:SAM-dependent methyltransferase
MTATPGRYTHGHDESVLRSHRWRTAANSAAYLLPHLRPGLNLLDVGCGPGTITQDFATLLAPGRVVGIDPSADVVEQARAALPQPPLPDLPITPGAPGTEFDFGAGAVATAVPTYLVADAATYAGQDPAARFDVVHAHQVLQHVADPVAVLRVLAELAVPGGTVAARDSDYSAMTWYPPVPELTDWMELYQAAARANGGEPDAGRRLVAWARASGCFAEVATSASVWCFATEEDRAWWGGMWADRILESAMARQVVDSGLAVAGDLRRISAGWRRWAEDPDGWFAVLHGEILGRTPS